ncbi:hypothetical protein DP62_5931 [Burkholderia pseudomallei]|nr:hypothetical protein DP62_5931 [Burkholderia pseudomallei]
MKIDNIPNKHIEGAADFLLTNTYLLNKNLTKQLSTYTFIPQSIIFHKIECIIALTNFITTNDSMSALRPAIILPFNPKPLKTRPQKIKKI